MTKKLMSLSLLLLFVFALAFTYSVSFQTASASAACDCIGSCPCHSHWEGKWQTPFPHLIGSCDLNACGNCNWPFPPCD